MNEWLLPEDDDVLLARAGLADLPAPDEGLFRDGCWLRRISSEAVLLFGGGRALLLEIAHPLVAAGVAEHSSFRTDPFGRLQRTLAAMSAITFKDQAAVVSAVRSVATAHVPIRGRLADAAGPFAAGTRYSGRDPELMRWVWATLVDTAWVVYERFVGPLDVDALRSFYGDQRALARVLGVPGEILPARWADFRSYFDSMLESDELTVTATAREIAEVVLNPPGAASSGPLVRMVTAALLPERFRTAFDLAWDAEQMDRFDSLTRSARARRSTVMPKPASFPPPPKSKG